MVWTVDNFRKDLATQCRVVGALLIREIYTRFGREGLGFGWILLEPLIFAIPVLLVWSIVRSPYEHGIPLMPMLWTGYLPILLFRHVGARMLIFVRVNAGLLYHRQVTIFDIFLARCILEVASNLMAVVASFVLFYAVGMLDLPDDLPMFYLGYFYMIWWSGDDRADCRRSQRAQRVDREDMATILVSLHVFLRVSLYGGMATTCATELGAVYAVTSGIRDDPCWNVRVFHQDLWRPCVRQFSARGLDVCWLAADAGCPQIPRG